VGQALLLVLAGFLLMEPVIYLSHRFVMHGPGFGIHKTHHRAQDGGFELNDLYPLTSAGLTICAMAAGATWPALEPLLLVGTGVTVYGLAYEFVHDVYIHRRLPWLQPRPMRVLEYLKEAHRIHHLYGGEPYGMLFPIVPAALRERAARTPADPFTRRRPAPVIT
jgi:beta-carotene 3-hydroxylase